MMLKGSLVTPDDATQPTTPHLIRKSDKVVLVLWLKRMIPASDGELLLGHGPTYERRNP